MYGAVPPRRHVRQSASDTPQPDMTNMMRNMSSHDITNSASQQLARVAPELRVAVHPGEAPVIETITPQAAKWIGVAPESLCGRALSDVFDEVIPALSHVVEQVVTSDLAVRDYRVAFTDRAGIDRAVVIQASRQRRGAGRSDTTVCVRFEELLAQPEQLLAERATHLDGLIGCSAAMQRVFRKIDIYGPTAAPVVVTGETGTGKELTAHALHTHSPRRRHPFVAVNCAALSEELLETELFGHERGAFTSAVRAHRGRFERAHCGTLFLDEIGELPLRLQVKLLRVLEEGVIERVGGEREVTVDVRLISATNVPLEQAVQARAFRLDLYHRLEVLRIHMPPLRERPEDLPLLAAHFLEQLNQKYQRHIQGITPEAMALLRAYDWPGNIRELRNVLERVVVETKADVLGRRAFDEWLQERSRFYPGTWDIHARESARAARPAIVTPYQATPPAGPLLPSPSRDMASAATGAWPRSDQSGADAASQQEPIDVIPRQVTQPLTPGRLVWAYQQADGNITRAARLLGVHKATFYRHMKAFGMTRADLDQRGSIALDQLAAEERPGGETHE